MDNEPSGPLAEVLTQPQTPKGPPKVATLRDQFAMAALTGLLADHTFDSTGPVVADLAYRLADAMLAEREKRP